MLKLKLNLTAIISLLLINIIPAFSQVPQGKGVETDLDSPYEAVYQQMANLSKDNWHPELAAKAFKYRGSHEEGKRLAIKLKKIFEAKALLVDYDEIPKDINYLDSSTKKNIFVPFEDLPEIYVEKYGDKWYYSKESVKHIKEIYEVVYPYSIEELIGEMPESLTGTFWGLYIWQYIGLLAYIIIAALVFFILKFLLRLILSKFIAHLRNSDIIQNYRSPISSNLSFLVAVVLFSSFLPALKLPIGLIVVFAYTFKILIPALIAFILYKMCDVAADIFDKVIFKSKTKLIDQSVPFIRKALKIIVVTSSVIVILQSLDVPITALLAGVSLGGLALALAAQDTIRHLFGSVTIFTDRPFEVGDWVVIEGKEGIVEEVGLRSTRIRTFYDSLITVPNGKLTDMVIDNMGKRKYRRYISKFAVTYDTPPDLIEAFIEALRKIVTQHSNIRQDLYHIYLNEFDNSSLNILFQVYFEAPDYSTELKYKHDILLEIIRIADELCIRFAFPTRTVHVNTFPEKKSLIPEYTSDKQEFMSKVSEYFDRRKKVEEDKNSNQVSNGIGNLES
jgi:MscS family membrane protein